MMAINGVMQGILSVVSGAWNAVKAVFIGVCNAVSGAISGAFNGIKSVIDSTMNGAKSTVSGALGAISGFFAGLHLEFPHINLPHFSISGDFSIVPPSVPSISVSWYRTGAIAMGASVVGIGEAGPEAVVPLSGREMDPFADAVARRMSATGRQDGAPDDMLERLLRELPRIIRDNTPRTVVLNRREFARLVMEVTA